jgi:hypothetical protein
MALRAVSVIPVSTGILPDGNPDKSFKLMPLDEQPATAMAGSGRPK